MCMGGLPDVLCLADLVVTPGCILPLLVCNSRAHWVLEQALSAAAPYTGLLAVVRGPAMEHRPCGLSLQSGCEELGAGARAALSRATLCHPVRA